MDEDEFTSWQNLRIGVLSFVFPIVGIVLAIVWWQEHHHTAKIVLICALISTVLLFTLPLFFGFIATANLV